MSEKSERLFRALNDIQEEKIDEAADFIPERKTVRWKRWAGLAAALAVAAGLGGYLLPRMGGNGAQAGTGGAGADGASTFMSYAGPVFPLTLKEKNENLTAVRDVTLDFEPWAPVWVSNEEQLEESRQHGATPEELESYAEDLAEWYPEGGYYRTSQDIRVTDSYVLTNSSDTDQRVSVLYPFVGTLNELEKKMPTLTMNGQELEPTLHVGGYTGGFQGGWGDAYQETGENPGSLNLLQLNSWEGYKALLTGGGYQAKALGHWPDLRGTEVTVYKFTAPWGPEPDSDKIPNPSIRAMFDLDYDKTTILTYGFHSGCYDSEAGRGGRGFSIPQKWQPGYGKPYYLIAAGEDIQNLTTQGYNTGGFDTKTTVEAGVTVERYTADLDAILREITAILWDAWAADRSIGTQTDSYEMYYGAFLDYLTTYGALSDSGIERYDDGMLESSDFDSVDRVMYLEAELTVPAGGCVELNASMTKEGSFDYHCAHTENQGVYGYDLVTKLGSNLLCTAQTATLEDRGQIAIVRQNFGFDLEHGGRTVNLDPGEEHYYLEVKRLDPEK